MIKYMTCNACHAVVEINNTGICLGCQMGSGYPVESQLPPKSMKSLKKRKKELEKALENIGEE